MARPIQPTPILEGEDAKRLLNDVDSASYSKEKEKFLNECRKIFNKTQRQWFLLGLDFSQVKAVRLAKYHDLSNFDCGDKDINDFIRDDAITYQENNLATTTIFIYNEDIIGFCSIAADSLKLKVPEKIQHEVDGKPIK